MIEQNAQLINDILYFVLGFGMGLLIWLINDFKKE